MMTDPGVSRDAVPERIQEINSSLSGHSLKFPLQLPCPNGTLSRKFRELLDGSRNNVILRIPKIRLFYIEVCYIVSKIRSASIN